MKLKEKFSNEYGPQKMVKNYLDLVKKHLNKDSVILDAGCGEGGVFSKSDLNKKGKRKTLIGIDLCKEKNPYVDKKFIGSLDKLPFKDNTFDIIICEWVVEHLEYPELVFNEFSRVLKKEGHLILFTPNVWNPLVFFSKIIPSSLKDAILKKFVGKEDNDLFPVFLRCNSVRSINKVAIISGFKNEFLKTYHNADYFAYSRFLQKLLIYTYLFLIKFRLLGFTKMYILADYKNGK